MDDTRYKRILATLDDLRCDAQDLLDELPKTSMYVLPLKRVVRHANTDLVLLQAGGLV